MSGWRWVAIVPLGLVFMVAGFAVLVMLVVAVPFSIAFHTLNTRRQR